MLPDRPFQDALTNLLALPVDFWMKSLLVSLGMAVALAGFLLLLSFTPLHLGVHKRNAFFLYLPVLWAAVLTYSIASETGNRIFLVSSSSFGPLTFRS